MTAARLLISLVIILFAAVNSSSQTTTSTFYYTGNTQTFVVPQCVTSIVVDISGAEGGGDASVSAPGGRGGRVEATMQVIPGQTIYIEVGGQGDMFSLPGYNGGGYGVGGTTGAPGGGGGGASDIRVNGTSLWDRVIVAGGGGGGTENGGPTAGGHGGYWGDAGSAGSNPWNCTSLYAATGGTQNSGGYGGWSASCGWNGADGSFGYGGDTYLNLGYRGGGGGGGWYGGGGAHNGGSGGGGSSYTDPSVTSVTHWQGYQSGDGIVYITYTPGLAVYCSAASNVVCIDDDSVALFGSPAGGFWTGAGTFGNMFSPQSAGTGVHLLTYSYTDINGCSGYSYLYIAVNLCVGITEGSVNSEFNLFPNPATDFVTISSVTMVGNVTIELLDAQGRVVFTSTENVIQPGFTRQIPLADIAEGFYLLRVTTSTEEHVVRVAVQ